jgi:hypothetical protein
MLQIGKTFLPPKNVSHAIHKKMTLSQKICIIVLITKILELTTCNRCINACTIQRWRRLT